MLRGIINTSLKFHILVLSIAAVLLVVGFTQIQDMPVDVLPEFEPPFVEIQTEALGLSAKEVEQLITVPMEQDLLNGVAWLDVIRSESVPGLSSILLFFEPGTDLFKARQMVSERLSQAAVAIPNVSKPPVMIQPLSSTSRFMIVGLSSQELSLIEMSVLARWTIGPRLMGVPGVANVAIWGQRERQLQVQVDPERLRANGISLEQILETTGNALWVSSLTFLEASTPGTGGFIDTPNQRLGIWHVLPITSPDDLAQVPVEGASYLRLGQVTNVVEDHQPLIGDAILNDSPNLMLVVEKFPGTNALEVTRGVEDALAALKPGLGGIEIDTSIFRPASFIELAVGNLSKSLLIAMFLILLVLGALLFEWRVALVSFITIPLAILVALLVFYARGSTLNAMVLSGLAVAIGIVIDDAIVDVDRISRALHKSREAGKTLSAADIILTASHEIRGTLIFATIIIGLAILPIFFVEGVTGAFFQPFAVSFLLAVLASMAVALTVTPALSLILFSKAPLKRRESPIIARAAHGYQKMIAQAVQTPKVVYIAAGIMLVVGIALIPFLRIEQLLPSFKEPYVMIEWNGVPGTSRLEMDRIIARASQELATIPGVRKVGAHVGRAVFGDQVVGINSANLWVSIDPAADYEATVTSVRETVSGYPGLTQEVHSYLQEVLRQSLSRSSQASVVRVFGENQDVLHAKADEIQLALSKINGVVDLNVDLPIEEPTLRVEVDLNAAQRYGIKPGDVRRSVATLISGLQVGSLFEDQKVFEVVVWSAPSVRQDINDIGELLIDRPGGGHVRLADVASVMITPTASVIRREGVSPYLDISFNMVGRDINAISNDVQNALLSVQFPLEYHAEFLGEFAERQAAGQRILIAGLMAILGIILVLQASFRNWRLAVITFLVMPVGAAGGIVAAFFLGMGVLTLGAAIGFLALFATLLRSSILYMEHYRRLQFEEGRAFGMDLIAEGGVERFAPAIMSTLTFAAAMLPFIIFGNVPGAEIIQPMAIVILAGLVTSTFFNLFVLPTLYYRLGEYRERDLELFTEPAPVAGEMHATSSD